MEMFLQQASSRDCVKIIVINGPLGIGKSTLSEALSESLDQCVMLDGDHLIAVNPVPVNETAYLHRIVGLLVAHHLRSGYRQFVVNHYWRFPHELEDLRRTLLNIEPDADIRFFLLTLSLDEHLGRIHRRRAAREIDEEQFELQTVAAERDVLYHQGRVGLGQPFDVSGPLHQVVADLLLQLDA